MGNVDIQRGEGRGSGMSAEIGDKREKKKSSLEEKTEKRI